MPRGPVNTMSVTLTFWYTITEPWVVASKILPRAVHEGPHLEKKNEVIISPDVFLASTSTLVVLEQRTRSQRVLRSSRGGSLKWKLLEPDTCRSKLMPLEDFESASTSGLNCTGSSVLESFDFCGCGSRLWMPGAGVRKGT